MKAYCINIDERSFEQTAKVIFHFRSQSPQCQYQSWIDIYDEMVLMANQYKPYGGGLKSSYISHGYHLSFGDDYSSEYTFCQASVNPAFILNHCTEFAS